MGFVFILFRARIIPFFDLFRSKNTVMLLPQPANIWFSFLGHLIAVVWTIPESVLAKDYQPPTTFAQMHLNGLVYV